MKKNYYDILQVNKNASAEIIEKAYKTLAKMYHPDLQEESNKKQAEEILKQINEAYEVLSDSEKKKNYDAFLAKKELNQEQLHKQKLQQEQLYHEQLQHQRDLAYQEQLQQAREQAYYDSYIQSLKNHGYKIRYKKSIKDYIKEFISIFLTLLILFLLWQIPFVQNFFIELFKENKILSALLKK